MAYRYMKKGEKSVRIGANEWARYRVDGYEFITEQEFRAMNPASAPAPKKGEKAPPLEAPKSDETTETVAKPLEEMSRDELLAMAKSMTIKVSKSAKKDEIVALIVEARTKAGEQAGGSAAPDSGQA